MLCAASDSIPDCGFRLYGALNCQNTSQYTFLWMQKNKEKNLTGSKFVMMDKSIGGSV